MDHQPDQFARRCFADITTAEKQPQHVDGRWYIQTSRFERQSFLMRSIGEDGTIRVAIVGSVPAP